MKVHGDRHIKGAKVPGSEKAREQEPGNEWPGSEKATERKFQGVNWPESYWPIRSGMQIGPGAKRLGTEMDSVMQSILFVYVTC